MEKPKIKRLSNGELLLNLLFMIVQVLKKYQKHLKDMQKVLVLK